MSRAIQGGIALGAVVVAMGLWLGRSDVPAVRAAGPCTEDSERARFVLGEFLATDPVVLSGVGLSGVDPDSVQVVTTNSSCAKLRNEFKMDYPIQGASAVWTPVYYEANNRYIVLLLRSVSPSDTIMVAGYTPVLVFDLGFNILETFAS